MIFLIFLPFFLVVILGAYLVLRPVPPRAGSGRIRQGGFWLGLVTLVISFGLLHAILLPPVGAYHSVERESRTMQTCRAIALAMFSYANDHDDHYPDGKSSTEVFQKLLDENYVSDAATFFVLLPGKVPATENKLTPENVGYDITSGVDGNSSDGVPIVFLTGFRIEYRAGGSAISLVKPFPHTASTFRWWHWFLSSSRDESAGVFDGLPVGYKSNNAWFRNARTPQGIQYTSAGFGIVPNILPADFDAHGQTYRQLTPEGAL